MIRVEIARTHARRRIGPSAAGKAVRMVLRGEGIRNALVTVVGVNSRQCRRLNRTFLGHDDVTDVISFPLEPAPRLEGEVYVNLDRARQQARAYGVSSANETLRLVVHGALHLAGYDDSRPRAAARMLRRQEEVVARLAGRRKKRSKGV